MNNIELKELIMGGTVNAYLVRILAQTLSEAELSTLIQELQDLDCTNTTALSELRIVLYRFASAKRLKESAMSEILRRNEPVKQLLDWYNDKKSGKVPYARKRLQERFLHLDYTDQVPVMKTLLSGGKTDRAWCYNTLRKWWTDDLTESIINVWNMYHEERCGWLFPKYLATEVIREHLDELCYDSNYYQVCKRLATEPWFKIDWYRLYCLVKDYQFMWVMSLTHDDSQIDEATSIINICIEDCMLHCLKESKFEEMDKIMSLDWDYSEKAYIFKIRKLEQMFVSMCRMGLYQEVKTYIEEDRKFQSEFREQYEAEYDRIKNSPYSKDYSSLLKDLYVKYARFYLEHYPPKCFLSAYGLESINEIFSAGESQGEECNNEQCPQQETAITQKEEQLNIPESVSDSNPMIQRMIDSLGLEVVSITKSDRSIPKDPYFYKILQHNLHPHENPVKDEEFPF